jgi:hypothetical protein
LRALAEALASETDDTSTGRDDRCDGYTPPLRSVRRFRVAPMNTVRDLRPQPMITVLSLESSFRRDFLGRAEAKPEYHLDVLFSSVIFRF